MKQVVQSYRTGELRVADVPAPGVEPGCILVRTAVSLVSTGTERVAMQLANKSIVGKARQRPDLVKKVLERVVRDGLLATGRAVFARLDEPLPLGYSCVGRVIAVGEGVPRFAVGDRVACAGSKVANHAELNLVPHNLAVAVPDSVDDEAAAFVTVGAIALQGLRTAAPTIGETFAVIGLGLIGQIAVQLLRSNGCRVLGIDVDEKKVALARELGCDVAIVRGGAVEEAAAGLTDGNGVDGVLICAGTDSNDPVQLAGALCRDRGRVVAVGAVGMEIPRRPYYDKELVLLQSRSYGPGRYDPVYEEIGIDYPIGYVRWTEQRNMQAFLDVCQRGGVKPPALVSHRFAIERASEAYDLIAHDPGVLGLLLTYPAGAALSRTVTRQPIRSLGNGTVRVGVIGAGLFTTGTLLPAIADDPAVALVCIASARGLSAEHLARKFGFARCSTDADAVSSDPEIDAVVIATRHHLHAEQAASALRGGKHVFVEKPLALDEESLQNVLRAEAESNRLLMVGFNRRFAPLSIELKQFFEGRRQPLVVYYRVNAGPILASSWIHDPAVGGGRILGEVCHFIDFVTFLTSSTPTSVFTHGVRPLGGARADDNVNISLAMADGSIATISYVATADASAGKERIEVLGDAATAVLEDFRELRLRRRGKEKTIRRLSQDKGHRAELKAFFAALRSGGSAPIPISELAAVTRATRAALDSLSSRTPIDLI
jgi:predicted dehydrogenase/threonine dehydrogenase-like Zn-dependent dehydrogenase